MVKLYCIFLIFIYFNVWFCIGTHVNRELITTYSYNAFVYAFDINNRPINKAGCSGAIISENLILTAANCLYFAREKETASSISKRFYETSFWYMVIYIKKYGKPPEDFVNGTEYVMIPVNQLKVYVGRDQPMRSSPFDVKNVYEHPQYEYGMPYYDLTFLKLANDMFLTRVNTPIMLTQDEAYYALNNSGLLTGYGQTEEGETMASRYLHSVRTFIAPPESCDQESDKDSRHRKVMRILYNSSNTNERPIFCARVHKEDDGMCKVWHAGSPFTVGEGSDRRLIGIASTPNICPNSTAIITSVQGMGNWSIEVE